MIRPEVIFMSATALAIIVLILAILRNSGKSGRKTRPDSKRKGRRNQAGHSPPGFSLRTGIPRKVSGRIA